MNRIAFSNLAAPEWTLERTVEAVHELGYDGLTYPNVNTYASAPASRNSISSVRSRTPSSTRTS